MRPALAALIAATAGMLLAGAAPGGRAAVYSEQQAAEGARIYMIRCAMCHGARLEGTVETPGLTGKFVANWAGRPIGDLYDYLGRAMPQSAPGSLGPEDNIRLLAFLLQRNGTPAGTVALRPDSTAFRRQMFAAAGSKR